MSVRNSLICLSVILNFVLIPLRAFAQNTYNETLTITTYYPAPYGVYGVLKLNPRTRPPEPCTEGEMTYDANAISTNRGIYYCNSTLRWSKISEGGSGGGDYWLENSTSHNIYNNNTGGRVGIGTTNPASKLSVHGGTLGTLAGNTLAIQELNSQVAENQSLRTFTRRTAAGSSWTTAELYLQRRIDASDKGFIKWPAGNGDIAFGSGANEHMRITETGNVGIGTTTPAQKLTVAGNISSTGSITVTGDVCSTSLNKCLSQIPPCPTCPANETCRPTDWVPPGQKFVAFAEASVTCCDNSQICNPVCWSLGNPAACPGGSTEAPGTARSYWTGSNGGYQFYKFTKVCVQ